MLIRVVCSGFGGAYYVFDKAPHWKLSIMKYSKSMVFLFIYLIFVNWFQVGGYLHKNGKQRRRGVEEGLVGGCSSKEYQPQC